MIHFTEDDIHVMIKALELCQSMIYHDLRTYNAPPAYKEKLLHDLKCFEKLEDKLIYNDN